MHDDEIRHNILLLLTASKQPLHNSRISSCQTVGFIVSHGSLSTQYSIIGLFSLVPTKRKSPKRRVKNRPSHFPTRRLEGLPCLSLNSFSISFRRFRASFLPSSSILLASSIISLTVTGLA